MRHETLNCTSAFSASYSCFMLVFVFVFICEGEGEGDACKKGFKRLRPGR